MEDTFKKKTKINLKTNGKLFPLYIMKNYKNFVIPKTIETDEDPCFVTKNNKDVNDFQRFIGTYMGYNTNNNSLLLYHDVGTGKTSKAIVFLNMIYNSNPNTNFFILIKASIRKTWENELEKFLEKKNKEQRRNTIEFINFDSPFSFKDFENKKKKADISNKNVYIIDECHLFISRVLTNMRSNKKNALGIYEEILKDKKENNVKLLCMSATPAINEPYELAVLFNLLRPDLFPGGENMFNKLFVDNLMGLKSLNYRMKNMFQRRIMGLVSYYKPGGLYGVYAKKITKHIDVEMSSFQTEKYIFWENYEKELSMKSSSGSFKSSTYKQYIRRASNFVFPYINDIVNNESRPKPSSFQLSNRIMEALIEGKERDETEITSNEKAYWKVIQLFEKETEKYFDKIYEEDKKNGKGIDNDIENFKKYETFEEYRNNEKNKSKLIELLINCSCKYIAVIFNIFKSDGPVICYMNNIMLEGLRMLKIYLKYFGFLKYSDKKAKNYFKYGDFTGDVEDKTERTKVMNIEQNDENVDGKLLKIIFFSSAGAEGISMFNIRQIHIIEPFWNEARIEQIIGRGIRRCSHKLLPIEKRIVVIYRYDSFKNKEYLIQQKGMKEIDENKLKTVDSDIETTARNKNNLLESFYEAMKEVAIDCELFKNDNMRKGKYKCFKFNEESYFEKNIGPAYREDIEEDMKINNGSNSLNSIAVSVKVIKIIGISDNNNENFYWYNVESGVIYDYELHYVVGNVKKNEQGYVEKINDNTYKVDIIEIPTI